VFGNGITFPSERVTPQCKMPSAHSAVLLGVVCCEFTVESKLTPCDKLIVTQLVKKFPTFYGTPVHKSPALSVF